MTIILKHDENCENRMNSFCCWQFIKRCTILNIFYNFRLFHTRFLKWLCQLQSIYIYIYISTCYLDEWYRCNAIYIEFDSNGNIKYYIHVNCYTPQNIHCNIICSVLAEWLKKYIAVDLIGVVDFFITFLFY